MQALSYISSMINYYRPTIDDLASSANRLQVAKSYTETYGDRAFSVAALFIWIFFFSYLIPFF